MIQSNSMAGEKTASTTDTCPACGTVIDTTDADPLVRIPCPKCGEKIRVHRSFNNFELIETLGIGGMGTVYKARDILLDRFVALKLLRKDLGDEPGAEVDYATRLQQEARVAASVNHPNVVQVFSSGKDHGQFYLVMELVDHGSLDDLIEQKKKLPEELVLEAGIQVAKGLRAANAKHLIHRDVKPANILFADEHTAKIGDFGLASVAAETGEAHGEIWGTPYYVAPERLNNQPEDFRSDIYSLGATLFHALAGRAPIEGDTNSATALRDLKTRPLILRTVAPGVSEETAKVLQRMIAPEPVKRFGSYDELVTALETAYAKLTGKELGTRKSRRPLIVIVALLLIALLGLSVWAYRWRQHSKSELNAVAARAEQAEQLVAIAPLEVRATEARKKLNPEYFNPVKGLFDGIAAAAKKRQPIYDWALLQAGMVAIIAHDMSAAKSPFQEVVKVGHAGFANEDADLGKFLVTTAETLLSSASVPPGIQLNPNNYEAFALFPFALKNIEQSKVSDAIPLLERFVDAKPAGTFAWIAEYQPLAKKYLDDCKLYVQWEKESSDAKDAVAVAKRLASTRELQKKIKTHAFLREINAAEKTLAHQVDDQKKTEAVNQERERKQKAEQAAQQVVQKRPQWLSDWKTKLIDDLNRTHFVGEITDAMGAAKYSGIDAAAADGLTVKIGPYGSAKIAWDKLAPKTLLAISTSFIKPNLPDAADRQWLCAVYAHETGQVEEAKKLAEAAAKAKPEYREQFALLNAPGAGH